MYWLDIVLIGLVAISTLISLARGFIREAFSLAIWIVAFWIAWTFFHDLAFVFEAYVDSPTIRLGASFALLLIATLLVGGMVNYLLLQLVDRTGLSGTDRFIGMIFGAARGVVLICALVLLAGLTSIPKEDFWAESQLIPYFQEVAFWLRDALPEEYSNYFRFSLIETMNGDIV